MKKETEKIIEYVKDAKINRIGVKSRHIMMDRKTGLPIFLTNEEVPEETSVRVIYRPGEIRIVKL